MQLLWSNMYPQSELDNYKLQVDLLQEKLKQSEENRQQLQKELQQILHRRSEHDKSVRTKLRQKYQSFLDDQERRSERNKMLMQMIERIDQQTAALSARSERLKMMKLQYERYFAKLMQGQPVHCIPNAMPTTRLTTEATPITAMTAPTQIPVLLPAVAAQPATTAPPIDLHSGLKSELTTAPTVQSATGHFEAMTGTQSAALTPRMWTFAMATPTPAGLLLSGAPTTAMAGSHGALPTAAAPFEFMQYPLGYGPIIQQQPVQQQMSYTTATPIGPSMAYGNQRYVPQDCFGDLRERKANVLNKYGLADNTAPTAEVATCTEFPSIVETLAGDTSNKQNETMPHSINRTEGSGEIKGSLYSPTVTIGNPTELLSTQSVDKLPRHQSDYGTSIKASVDTPAAAFRESSPTINEVISSISAVKLEDDDIVGVELPYTHPAVSSEEPKMSSRSSYNFEQDNSKKEGNTINLSTAEEHRRKIAEIEQRYGTIDAKENNDCVNKSTDKRSDETFTGFKRFSEIVNPKHEPSAEKLPTTKEDLDNHSWQSHTGSVEDAAMAPTSNVPSASKSISHSKIDNIENAIYGELVNPQLPETEVTTTRTAAQGFFTELLEQKQTPLEENKLQETQHQEYITKAEMETSNLSEDAEYGNYNPTIESDNTGVSKSENSINETIVPQNQVTYGTSNQELYQPTNTFTVESAYGTAETANNYADYPTEQNIDPTNPTDSTADQQQQEQQPDYSQQDYENYDATQYGNYDPNAYPGYIYDETTGQYVVDPQYAGSDAANNAEAIYTAQDYTEPQEQQQQQMEYPTDQVQEVSYAYEDQASTTTEQTAAAATPAEVTNLPTSPPAAVDSTATPAAKVVKPTSILSTTEKHAAQSDAQKKKKRVIFVDSSETDDSSSMKPSADGGAAAGGESDFDFSSGAEASLG